MVEAVELVACHVFHLADRDDQCVSIGMVRTRLDRLRECPPGCCQLCAAATKVAPADVYRIAKAWQWRPPPPGCAHCADRDRSTKSCRDRIGRLSQHTGAVPFVRLGRAQLARLGARSANLGVDRPLFAGDRALRRSSIAHLYTDDHADAMAALGAMVAGALNSDNVISLRG
jgi:hypothetical protein